MAQSQTVAQSPVRKHWREELKRDVANLEQEEAEAKASAAKRQRIYHPLDEDAYAKANANYPSLLLRRRVVHEALQCHSHGMTGDLAALISEYGLLPPKRQDDSEEESSLVVVPQPLYSERVDIPDDFDQSRLPPSERNTPATAVFFSWFREKHSVPPYSTTQCRLSMEIDRVVRIPRSADGLSEYEYSLVRDHWDGDFDAYCRDLEMSHSEHQYVSSPDPRMIASLDLYRERPPGLPAEEAVHALNLMRASLSFFYREFLRGACQCGVEGCKGRASNKPAAAQTR